MHERRIFFSGGGGNKIFIHALTLKEKGLETKGNLEFSRGQALRPPPPCLCTGLVHTIFFLFLAVVDVFQPHLVSEMQMSPEN